MKYVKIYTDFALDIEDLGFAERGRLFTAMLEYAGDGTIPSLVGNERYLWNTAKKLIDAQRESYEHRCAVNKVVATNRYESLRNVTKRNESLQEQEQKQEQEHKGNRRFKPPTYLEVKEYCSSAGLNNVDPNKFCDFYESKNWMVGRSKMKDWRAACRNWNRTDTRRSGSGSHSNYEQRTVTDDDFADLFLNLG